MLCRFAGVEAFSAMTLTLNIPDIIAFSWCKNPAALPAAVLEDALVEAYRQGKLSAAEVREALGHESRWDTEDFLASHGAWPDPSEDEVVAGAEALKRAHAR